MIDHQYIIGTGFYNRHGQRGDALAWFYRLWLENTMRYAHPFATYIIGQGDGRLPSDRFGNDLKARPNPVIWIPVLGNLGHVGQLLSGEKPYQFDGYAGVWMTISLLAYQNECDVIFKEQDTLAFGHYVDTMYREIGSKGCIFGSQRCMPCANSLFLVKHAFIPEFVRQYLGTPRQNIPEHISENKFASLEQQHPDQYCRYSFGVDRDRPFDVKAPVWYAQKFSRKELEEVAAAGLIDAASIPPLDPGDTSFSNTQAR